MRTPSPLITHSSSLVSKLHSSVREVPIENLSRRTTRLSFCGWKTTKGWKKQAQKTKQTLNYFKTQKATLRNFPQTTTEKKLKFLRSHFRRSCDHPPFLHTLYREPPAATYPTSHTYWTRVPDAKDVIMMYLSARTVLELMMAGGASHPPAGQRRE